jgi:hypothetical protein
VSAAARSARRGRAAGPVSSLDDLGIRLQGVRSSPGGHGRRLEAEVSLDLTDPANLAAVRGRRRDARPARSAHRLAEARCARWRRGSTPTGAVDVRVFRDRLSQNALGADVGAGAGFGAGYDRTEEARELLAAWSLRAGGRLQEREDCVPA